MSQTVHIIKGWDLLLWEPGVSILKVLRSKTDLILITSLVYIVLNPMKLLMFGFDPPKWQFHMIDSNILDRGGSPNSILEGTWKRMVICYTSLITFAFFPLM